MKEPEAKITNTNQRHVLICGGRTQLNYDDFEKCVLEVLTENNLSDIEIVSAACRSGAMRATPCLTGSHRRSTATILQPRWKATVVPYGSWRMC